MDIVNRFLTKIVLPDVQVGSEFGLIALGVFGLVAGVVIHWAIWLMKYGAIAEIGHPMKAKTRRKRLSKYRWYEKMFLTSIIRNAPVKKAVMWFYWALNLVNLVLLPLTMVSAPLLIITGGAGWAFTLMLEVPVGYLFVTTIITFVPDLIFIKSERERYRFR